MEQQNNKLNEKVKRKPVKLNSVQEIAEHVQKYFKERVWIYAVLDFAVGFGVYEDNQFLLRLGNQKEFVPLDWKYLRELRVFNKCGELRLTPLKDQWVCRFRGSNPDGENSLMNTNEFYIDECQKLWGKAKVNEKIKELSWSLLTSDRGTQIWVPIDIQNQGEAAIRIRRYMRIPTIDDLELVFQTDMCMVDFCLWEAENTKGGQCING